MHSNCIHTKFCTDSEWLTIFHIIGNKGLFQCYKHFCLNNNLDGKCMESNAKEYYAGKINDSTTDHHYYVPSNY